jgi:hypothetical protein
MFCLLRFGKLTDGNQYIVYSLATKLNNSRKARNLQFQKKVIGSYTNLKDWLVYIIGMRLKYSLACALAGNLLYHIGPGILI